MWPLSNLLKTFVRKGQLTVIDVDGSSHRFGSGEDGPHVTMRLHDKALRWKLFLNPELQAAEAYMDGGLTFEEGSGCYDLLYLFSVNRGPLASHKVQGAMRRGWRAMRRRQQQNDVDMAKRQARHHYDLSTELYELFLDNDLNYSCAFYRSPDDTLEQAQAAKLNRATAKLQIKPGMSVVEIGSGWGSFAIRLAKEGAQVTALNVSPEQIAISKERAKKAGVADKIDFVWKDYREFNGSFDRVLSVGMMEHVGIGHFDAYFGKVRDLLKPDGYAFIHSIGRMTQPGTTGPFFRKYIFPGGYVPALSEAFAATERQGLWVADMEVLRLHYYYTLREWRARFEKNRDKAKDLYDERFCRMWEFYLGAAELGFLHGSNMVFQLLLSRERDAVPIDRNFICEAEKELTKKSS
ncbi:MAG: cyclopropane-fatty-acyl-phospholipid synthase family protein [Hyphomicrobiaceae bacterium]|nr:cyclopropane-fatty-acyl-phospholipid synthase family protein [Hyphomicrobiaceae bacterium]